VSSDIVNADDYTAGVREWFRWYKTPDGKPLNAYGYNEECLDANHAVEVIQETHIAWRKLVDGKVSSGQLWTK
jgi:inorganic pyrophosphatase